jgi:hypothetical protein
MLNTASDSTSRRRARLARSCRPGQPCTVDQAGVVEGVGEHGVVAARQGRHDAAVGHVARGEQQRARQAGEACQGGLGRLVLLVVAGDQVRCGRAHAAAADGLDHRLRDARVAGQAEVVVGGEGQQRPAVDFEHGALGPAHHPAGAAQPGGLEGGELGGETLHGTR